MDQIKQIIKESIDVKERLLNDPILIPKIKASVDLMTATFKNKGSLWFCGNGGSAADAQHLAAEFTGRFYKDRDPLSAEALHVNTSYLTAVGNDYSFDLVYSRMLKGKARKGDLLVAISTSGNSANIIECIKTAKTIGVPVIGFTGETGGKMADLCDILINIPSKDTPRIQESHILVGHIMCYLVEENLF
jgi:D-sedoheptulose 7-phosphate isomerase